MPAPLPLTARIEVFRPGTFKPMEGEPISYSAADLRAMADAYDPDTAPAPVVIGHPDTDAPAFGWVERFEYDPQVERLFAHLHEIEPQFADLVKDGRFKKVSMAFFGPGQGHNPVPGTWYPKHVGFLGAAAPAVSGLTNARFADPAAATFTAAFGMGEETASILRSLRDFFIDKFGLEEADKALPPWRIEWLEAAEEEPHFAAPLQPPEQEPPLTTPTDPAFAAREAEVANREARLAAREAELAHQDHLAFAEGLVQDGRLLPASRDKVVAILDALPVQPAVAFAEGGEKISAGAAIRDVLKAQPKIVSFGEEDLGEDPGTRSGAASFASDGQPVDAAALVIHNKALAYQRQNPGTAYLAAVAAVS